MARAFVIEGTMRNSMDEGFTAIVGVAFLPDGFETPSVRMLENMGFRSARCDRSLRFEEVQADGGAPSVPTLYFYDKSAAGRTVFVARLNSDGFITLKNGIRLSVQRPTPRDVIPAITGIAAVRLGLANPTNALGPGDFQFPKRTPSSGQGNSRRQVYAR